MSEKTSAVTAGLLEIIQDFKGADFAEPKGDASGLNFFDDFGLDSLEMINLLFQIEEKYGVRLSDEELRERNLMVLGNMAAFISENQKNVTP